MSVGTNHFEASPFCRNAAELDLNYALVAIERSLAHPELRPNTREALERVIDIIRAEELRRN